MPMDKDGRKMDEGMTVSLLSAQIQAVIADMYTYQALP